MLDSITLARKGAHTLPAATLTHEKHGGMRTFAHHLGKHSALLMRRGSIIVHHGLYLKEYDEAMDRLRLGAACITDSDHQLLAKVWRAALAAAASIDPADETPVGDKVNLDNPRRYYRWYSAILEKILEEKESLQQKKYAELKRKLAEREPEDFSDVTY